MTDLRDQKRALRAAMKTRRAEVARQNPDAPSALSDLFLKTIELAQGSIVAFYIARESEIDPAALAAALHAKGHPLCLPVVAGAGKPLLFRAYAPGEKLAEGRHGIPEPFAAAPLLEPDCLLVPLLAFDRRLHRLGYGGGYYDRTLTNLRQHRKILAIGVAFAAQEVVEVPAGPTDIRLDKIVTEREVL